ncbi:MAG TPA: glycosyl hydrolase 53 family protein [Opitutaceae bacterium]|nr:glycosyl hydrolase 53 family protein [Opitutaceae bacterium]
MHPQRSSMPLRAHGARPGLAVGFSCALLSALPTVAVGAAPFANGSDPSWITQMEASGIRFYNGGGTQQDCLRVLQGVGVNAIRLRVWVNPAGGWCDQADVVSKAVRARNLGQRVLIDFHYSDTWADPGHQTKPAAWANDGIAQLNIDVTNHTTAVLAALKAAGVAPEWVQVGNETNNGMLWPDGMASTNMGNFAALVTSGYNAVKSVFPDALVVVHVSNGYDDSLFRFVFDGLKQYGARYDVIGMSLYPTNANWATLDTQCLATMNDMVATYGKPVMVVEVGMDVDSASACESFLADIIGKVKSVPGGNGLGVFYWEPEAYNGWQGYTMGAFGTNGAPTVAMNAFVDAGVSPYFISQPSSQTIATGGTVVFSAPAAAIPAPTYQWDLNGTAIAGATGPTLLISGATPASAGSYTCVATNPASSATSAPAALAVRSTADIGRLVNISCRATVGTGANILIAGFVVGGAGTSGSEALLIRGSGPALVPFGVAGTLADPQLQIFSGASVLGTNDGWAGNAQIASTAASVGAFAWTSPTSHDAALLETLPAGAYTAQIAGQSADTGVALAELYDATPAGAYTLASPRIVNIAARVQVGTGGSILIAGFVIGGSTSRTVLIRASGPALIPFGVPGTLPDPQLQLYSGSTVIGSNTGWAGDPQISATAAAVGAFSWVSPTSSDSAILVTLPPGAYTAQVSGASGDTGVALVEAYEVP